jgi:hypothetical protein
MCVLSANACCAGHAACSHLEGLQGEAGVMHRVSMKVWRGLTSAAVELLALVRVHSLPA